MIALIYACTNLATGMWCSTHPLPLYQAPGHNPTICMMAQAEIARWAVENPEWTIDRWDCQPVRMAMEGVGK